MGRLPIRIRTYNSGGKGGQHGNRSYNAVEASTTLPSGEVVKARSEMKSQHRSKRMALAVLRARVEAALQPEAPRGETAGWGSVERRVRTYHEPDDRVVDTTGHRTSYRETVGKGDLSSLIEARRATLSTLSPADHQP